MPDNIINVKFLPAKVPFACPLQSRPFLFRGRIYAEAERRANKFALPRRYSICGREAYKYRRSPKKSAPDSKTAHMNKKVKYRIETVMMPGTRGRTFALLLKNR